LLDGGRQILQSAQMYLEDFDGIIAGSAASDFDQNTKTIVVGHTNTVYDPTVVLTDCYTRNLLLKRVDEGFSRAAELSCVITL